MIQSYRFAAWVTLISAIAFSTKAIFAKLAYRYGVDPFALLTIRMIFSVPFFVGVLLFHRKTAIRVVENRDHTRIFAVGLIGFYLSAVLDFKGLQYVSAGVERTILYTYPTIVAVVGFLWFKQRIERTHILALGATYIGLVLTLKEEISSSTSNATFGVVLIFLSAIAYSFYLIGSRSLVERYGALRFTCYSMIVATFALAIQALFFIPPAAFHVSSEVLVLTLNMSIFSTVIPLFTLSFGVGRLGASRAAIISSVGPVATVVFAMIFLDEWPNANQYIGMSTVIAGVLLVCLKRPAALRPRHSLHNSPLVEHR